ILLIQYPSSSSLSQLFNNTSANVTAGTSGADTESAVFALNDVFVRMNSTVRAISAATNYSASIKADPDSVSILLIIHASPILENVVMGKKQGDDLVDLRWKDIVVTNSIPLYSNDLNQKIDVNRPIGLLQAKYPALASTLVQNHSVASILNTPLFNFSQFD